MLYKENIIYSTLVYLAFDQQYTTVLKALLPRLLDILRFNDQKHKSFYLEL